MKRSVFIQVFIVAMNLLSMLFYCSRAPAFPDDEFCGSSISIAQNKSLPNQNVQIVYEKLGSRISLWGREIKEWVLPVEKSRSFLDELGTGSMLAKLVTRYGEIVVSRKELEGLIPPVKDGGAVLRYEGAGRRFPEHWREFPAIIQDIRFEPPIGAIWVNEKGVEFGRIEHLRGISFFTYYPKKMDDGIPILYKQNGLSGTVVAVLLIKPEIYKRLSSKHPTVKRVVSPPVPLGDKCIEKSTINLIDLDGDGGMEMAYFRKEVMGRGDSPDLDCENKYSIAAIAIRQGMDWYLTGQTADVRHDSNFIKGSTSTER